MARAGTHDITTDQGSSFLLHLSYQDNSGVGQSLNDYTSRMQVRRSADDPDMLLAVTGTTADYATGLPGGSYGVTGGGTTGEFTGSGGVAGTGYINLDVSSAGATGSTGGILVTIDATTMANVPSGRHVYDLEIVAGVTVSKLLRGRFEVEAEITK